MGFKKWFGRSAADRRALRDERNAVVFERYRERMAELDQRGEAAKQRHTVVRAQAAEARAQAAQAREQRQARKKVPWWRSSGGGDDGFSGFDGGF